MAAMGLRGDRCPLSRTGRDRHRRCRHLARGLAFPLRSHAMALSSVHQPVLTVVCEPCGRRERYDVERLMRQYGWDAKLTDLLPALVADCPKMRSVSVYDRCKAVFERRG
jgi:hypothetical protein